MPNATARANARTMPKPKPGTVASIRRQTAELRSATAEVAEPNAIDALMTSRASLTGGRLTRTYSTA
jgi:hypothetical protein